MEKEIKYKGKVITVLFSSGYYQVYSDKEERFLKFDELDDAKALIDSEEGMKRGGDVGKGDVVTLKNDVKASYSTKVLPKGTELILKATPVYTNKKGNFVYAVTKDGKHEIRTEKSDFVEKIKNIEDDFSNGGGIRSSNKDSRSLVQSRTPFNANNLSGEFVGDVYVVKSYGYYPIFVYKNGKWYENQDKYSKTTSKQMSQSRPTGDVEKVSTDELKAMYGFENGGEFEAASELRSLENTIENHLVNGQNISVEMLSMYLGRKPNYEENVVGVTVRKCFLQPYFKKIK